MSNSIITEPIPLQADADEVIRVAGTRVTLDAVVAAFEEGATAEEIAVQYPSLNLADVYAVISYYLRRRFEVKAYLDRRQRLAEEVRQESESRLDTRGVRERLLARQSEKG